MKLVTSVPGLSFVRSFRSSSLIVGILVLLSITLAATAAMASRMDVGYLLRGDYETFLLGELSFYFDTNSTAVGALTNGGNHTGVIAIGGTDTWTFSANVNDSIVLSLGEVLTGGPDPAFTPRLRLVAPDGFTNDVNAGSNSNVAAIGKRFTLAGTYTVLVSNKNPTSQTAPANYTLTVVKTPGPYTLSPNDQGGPMTNGTNHAGTIFVGDLDPWTFQATLNNSITISLTEVLGSPDPAFSPAVRLYDPNGLLIKDISGPNSVEFSISAPITGTYTVLVLSDNLNQIGTANYTLTLVRSPGPYTISPGDEGGPMTNGGNHTGVIGVNDVDPWTFPANVNDSIVLSLGEVLTGGPDPAFTPRLRLVAPDGSTNDVNAGSNSNVAAIGKRFTLAGTYTVLVSNKNPTSQTAPANYTLTVVKTPGPYTVSPNDKGGPMTNGTNHAGTIFVGDLDPWTFQATLNDSITLNLTEVLGSPDAAFSPAVRLYDPNGLLIKDISGPNSVEFSISAPITGTYTVLVLSDNLNQIGTANYTLTLVRSPGPYTISPGDEGGPMTNGGNHTGVIGVNDVDPWTFPANANDSIVLSLGEVLTGGPDPAFTPRLRLVAPDGSTSDVNAGSNSNVAAIGKRFTLAGTYTVLVSNKNPTSQTAPANYTLTVVKTPGPYTLSPNDQGGPMTNGTNHAGTIFVGDLDPWTFQATLNNSITISLTEVLGSPDPAFSPAVRLYDPNGLLIKDISGPNSVEFSISAPITGTYTVLVLSDNLNQIGTANYTLRASGISTPTPTPTATSTATPTATATPSGRTAFDYDGDRKSDISVFRPSNGAWYLQQSQVGLYGTLFGVSTDKIAPADYDGDGRTDIAVYRPATGIWYVFNSSNSTVAYFVFGVSEDLPTAGDYDGDGKADISVFRPSTATWYRQNSSDGSFFGIQFGASGDKPTTGDFDGDRKTDIGVYRPLAGAWYRINSSNGSQFGVQFGSATDLITPADYDGDGKTDIAVYRPSTGIWYVTNSTNGAITYTIFGLPNDIPAPGDFDGDGKADVCVFRPTDGNWYRQNSSNGLFVAFPFGASGDKPTQTAYRY